MIARIRLEFLHDGKDGFELLSYLQMEKESNMLPEESFDVADRSVKCSGYFSTLDEGTGENNYRKAKDALNKYFKPQANFPYERLYFREMSQLPSESVEQFVTQVRQKAQSCEFGDVAAVDEQIRDQVISKCLSHNIRRKLLEKGKILTLQQLREIARVMEDSEKQARMIEGAANEVNRVGENSNEKGNPRVAGKQGTVRCFVVEMWFMRPMIKFARQEENGAESVIIRAISSKCAKLN